jgi:hypothetical protein
MNFRTASAPLAPSVVSNLRLFLVAYNVAILCVRLRFGHNLARKELIPMAIDIEHLKQFQSEQLEQKNIQTSARIPIHSRTIEWALLEIVILLTGIGDSLKRMADRP